MFCKTPLNLHVFSDSGLAFLSDVCAAVVLWLRGCSWRAGRSLVTLKSTAPPQCKQINLEPLLLSAFYIYKQRGLLTVYLFLSRVYSCRKCVPVYRERQWNSLCRGSSMTAAAVYIDAAFGILALVLPLRFLASFYDVL